VPGGPGRFRSLGTRIALWYGGLLFVCIAAYSVAAATFVWAHVEVELDRRLHEDIELATRALLVDDHGMPRWPGGSLPREIDEEPGGGHWLEVWSPSGERLLAMGTLEPVDLGSPPDITRLDHVTGRLDLPIGTVRVLTEPVRIDGVRFVVRAAVSEMAARRQVHMLWAELGALSLAVLMLGGFGGYVIASRALDPLVRMAARARRITAEQLHERLPVEGQSLELDQLAAAFNDTLARLEGSFGQLRSFTADASHELRTPLTALRSVGEVGLRGAKSTEDCREVIGSMLEEVDRLARLADELLTLARAEAGEARLRLERLDLSLLAREVVDHLCVLAEEREQTLEAETSAPVMANGDRLALRQAVVNLADNAIKYSAERTCVSIATGSRDGEVFIEVRDEGPGLAQEHHERVFERFYRVDRSRSRELGGTGLGLSLVKWTAEAHGGRVELTSAEGRGSVFRIVLPSADRSG
jgi:heavy metal sensor kinase